MNENINVKLAEIVLYTTPHNHNKVLNTAKSLVVNLRKGADFKNIAKELSQASSAPSGGEIGWVYIQHLAPQLAKHLLHAAKGYISDPITLEDGIYILKVLDTKQNKVNDETINAEEVKELLIDKKLNVAIRAYIKKLRELAYIKVNI
jgi:peptidyl-prolyl cis-trans isomerase SurA